MERLPDLRITGDEVSRAVPLPRRVTMPAGSFAPIPLPPPAGSEKRSGLAVAALFVALAAVGMPVAAYYSPPVIAGLLVIGGILAGILAVVLASLALGGIHHSGRRGVGIGVASILLGLIAAVGSIVVVAATSIPAGRLAISIDEFEPDPDALKKALPAVARAVRANALIETKFGGGILGGVGIGSGVVMLIEKGSALVLTNRHVVDPEFTSKGPEKPGLPDGHLQVKLIGQPTHPGRVVWIAPDDIDLALVRVDADGTEARAAPWDGDTELIVGSDVFTVGNPEHLDWTHTRGSISALRWQQRGPRQIHIIQTDAALNHGNSGGGLYDKSGNLIGINTWIDANQASKGLGFSIALRSLLDLDPPGLHAPEKKPAEKKAKKPGGKPAGDEEE
jgi:S1-C subfamily serine protease